MFQGSTIAAQTSGPQRQWSRFQHAVGPPHHHETMLEAAISTGAAGDLVRMASPSNTQKSAAVRFDGRCASSHKQNWHPTTQNIRVASVVAIFDSAMTMGLVARTSAESIPARAPSIRRPQAQTSTHVAAPATAEASRA